MNGNVIRVVLTGGPGGGKTTAADLFRRELGEQVAVVPEAATMLYGGGFPRHLSDMAVRKSQRAIYHLQRTLEDIQWCEHPGRVLLCDRGTVDGAAYWPENGEGFFEAMETTIEDEYNRYDAVVFFESAACGGLDISSNNPVRLESAREAAYLDARLRKLWSGHPNFILIRHHDSFFAKITAGLSALQELVG